MSGPLSSLQVVELGGIGPAPFVGMMLADQGADVIVLERPAPAGLAAAPPEADPMRRGKRSIAVDLKSDEGRRLAQTVASKADVVIEGFRPGVAGRLGLDYATLQKRNRRLVYGHVTGWGQDGPRAEEVGHDLGYLALTGVLHAIGAADRPPPPPLNLIGDFGGGSALLAFGVLAAVLAARESGEGSELDGAIVDGVSYLASSIHGLASIGYWSDERQANILDGGAPFYACYETKDGRHLSVAALEAKFYLAFVEGLGFEPDELPNQMDPSRWGETRDLFASTIAERTLGEWCAVFEGSDACVVPVRTLSEARADPHMAARDVFGGPRGTQVRAAPRILGSPPAELASIPSVGMHTAEVARAAGLSDETIETMAAAGTLALTGDDA